MKRSTIFGTALLAITACESCHKKTLPPPPAPVPAAHNPPRRSRETPQAPVSAPTVQTASPPAAQEPEFRLGQTLTPEQQRAYNVEIDQHIQRATQALGKLGNRALTQQQKTAVEQIRGFITQAQQMRRTDAVRAKSLAERADILTQDLVSTLQK